MSKFTFIDLFAGIGGFRNALESFDGECVFSSEWDKYSQETYEKNYHDKPKGDITKVDAAEVPKHDVLCAGFPCQAFSMSGSRKGLDDIRGTLFKEIVKIANYHQPKVLFLENVKHLIQHSAGTTFKIIKESLEEIGYDVHYKVLKADKFGIPQVRERVYFICFRRNLKIKNFEFPEGKHKTVYLIDFLEKNIERKEITNWPIVYKDGINLEELDKHRSDKPIQIGQVHQGGMGDRIYSPYGQAVTITAGGGGNFSKTNGYYIDEYPRRLTARECANIMGFPKSFKIHDNPNVARKQFGNSVAIPVLKAIFKNVINIDDVL